MIERHTYAYYRVIDEVLCTDIDMRSIERHEYAYYRET